MSSANNIVAVAGSVSAHSRTQVLVQRLLEGVEQHAGREGTIIQLGDFAAELGSALTPDHLAPRTRAIIHTIEQANLLIVGSPVYRGSYPGLLKHLFDLVDQHALTGTPVLLAATGGSDRHALMIEHQLRPLFAFFQALTLPLGVYASTRDFDGHEIASAALLERIDRAVDMAARFLPATGVVEAGSRPLQQPAYG